MIPLKRIFPVIVILITLSLMGIIYIQVSWIRSAVQIKKEQLFQRSVGMIRDVLNDMLSTRQTALMFKLDGRVTPSPKGFTIDVNALPYTPTPLSDFYSVQDLRKCIQTNMRKNHLDSTHFEFAVLVPSTGYSASIKKQSAGFEKMYHAATDSNLANNNKYKVQLIPLVEPNDLNQQAESLMVIIPTDDSVAKQLGLMITGGVLFTMIIITAFALTIRTLLNQKKLSEIKSDFINNMTHELKTPLATISLAIDAIRNEKVMSKPEKIHYFSGIIKEENKRMNKQVESILQSALLEKDEIGLKLQATDAHAVIQSTTDNLQLQLAAKNGVVDLQLDAINPVIMADDVHFSNLIFNLMDNAIKYSNDNLEIKIQTYNTRKSLFIVIADNGIGMSRDTISRIFEKFYRAHTGNVHNVKGFGLGLTYVKAIVDAHKGKIKVESTIGKGSKFTLEFPQE
ncbi:two-component system phosphate regulon sensor histidine kinase PhoR [Chitinophaga niastensis]|uniref:histidine kinase n=1 Tax=Chitinophaga niastensis TaxID=536980 RepID=A0A2P8HV57_CHINA|nr:HAMP domain-containing sensor histidine kinase [Chitinophaga niastensis]PSL50044.1 two-component system phosphate regulon sensor histidine kinase PhoR [Chitinophaga niastensis]